jgi:hypothetical protein
MNVAKLSALGIGCLCLAFSQPVQASMLTLGVANCKHKRFKLQTRQF